MRPWYRNSTLQMDDAEMEWLQSKDAASCAVWEWYKCDSQKRGDGSIRDLSEQEKDTISRRLGIDSPRFSQISQNLHAVKWISQKAIRGWQKWQGARTPEEDAARKQAEYWKRKALEINGPVSEPELSPKTSHSLPKPPLEERRGEHIIKKEGARAREADFSEIPTEDEAVLSTMCAGIPQDFARYIYGDWATRGGRDGAGILVPFVRLAAKRWAREQNDWKAKTHKGTKVPTDRNGNQVKPQKSLLSKLIDEI